MINAIYIFLGPIVGLLVVINIQLSQIRDALRQHNNGPADGGDR